MVRSTPVEPVKVVKAVPISPPQEKVVGPNLAAVANAAAPEPKVVSYTPPLLIAREDEVREFFANYTKVYVQKDIETFLSFFSSRAVQNEKDGLDDIRRIYRRFFIQSQEIRYQLQDLKFEIYQNGVEARAHYELDQMLRRDGEKRAWKGSIRWVLIRENGSLKIVSLDYKHQ